MCKIGILGFGVVGKSALAFFSTDANISFQVWDERHVTDEERVLFRHKKIQFFDASKSVHDFINESDYVVVSPGININKYDYFAHKLVCELDLFVKHFANKTIAITGSLGKTTITKLLGSILQKTQTDSNVCIGGNVGIGMLDLINQPDSCDMAVLELSSFQLERSNVFAPDVAIWTNWYPNHLDRHGSAENYFQAKANLIRFQKAHQYAVLSYDLWDEATVAWMNNLLLTAQSFVSIYTDGSLADIDISKIACNAVTIFYIVNDYLHVCPIKNGVLQRSNMLFDMSILPDCTFKKNWVAVLASLYVSGFDLAKIQSLISSTDRGRFLEDHHHRIELCATINGVDFYDDSKSTVIQATIAAFNKLAEKKRPIILILGGLGKGVDRAPALSNIQKHPQLKRLYCFGSECSVFSHSIVHATLEETLQDVMNNTDAGDIVLFSPSGASFDLFKNYGHRGDTFQKLVNSMQ